MFLARISCEVHSSKKTHPAKNEEFLEEESKNY